MRARVRRRQTMRRVTILVTVALVAVSLVVGIYLVMQASGPSKIDSMIGQPVSATDLTNLYHASLQPYGPAPPTSMTGQVKMGTGGSYMSNGKPVVVYVGADFCEFCAVQRWGLVMALMRFGNFTGLQYMASGAGSEGDFPTFTFSSSSYSSPYVVFHAYEVQDRDRNPLVTVPGNYSTVWSSYGSGFPFMNFGNSYVVPSSTLLPGGLAGKNWSQVITGISTSDSMGIQVRESANLLTALICKITNERPASVCTASPIAGTLMGMAGPASSGMMNPSPYLAPQVQKAGPERKD